MRPRPAPRPARRPDAWRVVPGERGSDLLGAEPGAGPGRPGRPAVQSLQVLVGLANHAGPDGTAAFPSVRTLMRYTGLAERTVRACLSRLEAAGVISPCDPAIIAARIRRADRRPRGWDLSLARIRGDLTQAEIAALERQFPGLAARLAAAQADDRAGGPGTPEDGVHPPPPPSLWITRPAGCRRCTPYRARGAAGVRTGCSRPRHGAHPVHPNRTKNQTRNRPPPRARARPPP